jgi:hypothetical protein
LTITGGSSIAAMIFKLPPQFGQCSIAAKVYLALFSASLSESLETTQPNC